MGTLDKDLPSKIRHREPMGHQAKRSGGHEKKIGGHQRSCGAAKVLSGMSDPNTMTGTADPIDAGIPSSSWKRSELRFALAFSQ